MRKGTRSLIVVVGLAVVVFLLTTSFLAAARNTEPALVAARALQPGVRLDERAVEVRQLPQPAILPGTLTSIEDVRGQTLVVPRMPGDQITAEMVGSEALSAVSASLPPDHRAVAVHVDRATGLAGLVQVGDTVTVIGIIDPQALNVMGGSTYIPETPGGKEQSPESPVAMVAIPGLRVLLVPQLFRYHETLPDETGGGLMAPVYTSSSEQNSSVVLLDAPLAPRPLTPDGTPMSPAEVLALLNAKGAIHLALEPLAADYSIPPTGVQLFDLYDSMRHTAQASASLTPTPEPVEPALSPVEGVVPGGSSPPAAPTPTGAGEPVPPVPTEETAEGGGS